MIDSSDKLKLDAFSHWTYDFTRGKYLWYNLQGTYLQDTDIWLVVDPNIASNSLGKMGQCDGGKKMQYNWFSKHECNQYCNKKWLKPRSLKYKQKFKCTTLKSIPEKKAQENFF